MKKTLILSVKDLSVSAFSKERETRILNSISFSLKEDEILGIVGESGSGKSITALSILKLLPKTALKITSGLLYLMMKS